MSIGLTFTFEKADPTGRFVRGFAYVCKDRNGNDVVDYSGDVVDIDVLREGAHEFMADARIAKVLHGKTAWGQNGKAVGDIVEAVMIDDEFAKALGITDNRRGWWIGMRVDCPVTQKRVRDRSLTQFSLGGRAATEKIA